MSNGRRSVRRRVTGSDGRPTGDGTLTRSRRSDRVVVKVRFLLPARSSPATRAPGDADDRGSSTVERRLRQPDHARASGDGHGFETRVRVELREDPPDVVADGVRAQHEPPDDLLRGEAL